MLAGQGQRGGRTKSTKILGVKRTDPNESTSIQKSVFFAPTPPPPKSRFFVTSVSRERLLQHLNLLKEKVNPSKSSLENKIQESCSCDFFLLLLIDCPLCLFIFRATSGTGTLLDVIC